MIVGNDDNAAAFLKSLDGFCKVHWLVACSRRGCFLHAKHQFLFNKRHLKSANCF